MPEPTPQPAQEAPTQRDQVVKAALRTVKPHQLQENGEARFFVGRGKKREEIALSHAEIKKMMVEQEIDKLVARRSRLQVESRKGGDVTPEDQQDAIALAESMQEEVKAVRGAVDGKKRSEKVLAELDKRGVLAKRRKVYLADDTLRSKAEQAVEKKIGASERGILGNKIATRYKETAEQYPQAAELQGTPKERLQQLLSSDLIDDAQKQALREQLSKGLTGYDGNSHVDTFNNRLQQEWNPQNTQTEAEVVSGQEAQQAPLTASTESASVESESAEDQPAEKTEGSEITANSSWHDAIENVITVGNPNAEAILANEDRLLEELPKYMGRRSIPLEQGVAYVQERFGPEGVAKLFDSIGTYRDGLSRYDEKRFLGQQDQKNLQVVADYWMTTEIPALREKLGIPEPEIEGKEEIPPMSSEQWRGAIDTMLDRFYPGYNKGWLEDQDRVAAALPIQMVYNNVPLEVGTRYFQDKFGEEQTETLFTQVEKYRDAIANDVAKTGDPMTKGARILELKKLDDWLAQDIPAIRESLNTSQSSDDTQEKGTDTDGEPEIAVSEQPEASSTQEEPVEAAPEQTQGEADQVQQEVPLQLDDEPGVAIPPPPSDESEPATTEPELAGVGAATARPATGRSFFSRIFGR